MAKRIITLLTDFGLQDTYVASMKGVILTLCPDVCLIDVSHLAPPRDVRAGAFLLACAAFDFPSGTIHLAVVDPGVGTERRGLAIEADRHFFVGPDNGLFSRVLGSASVWEAFSLEEPAYWLSTVSKTFHGRDIFAPVAAHMATGVPLRALGPPCTPQPGSWSEAREEGEGILGEILHIDHFGNAVTNVSRQVFERFASRTQVTVQAGDCLVSTLAETYGDQDPAGVVALMGSHGYLEIAVNQGSAALSCRLHRGDPVRVSRE
jgi:S-adenosylmethionine hydrolase